MNTLSTETKRGIVDFDDLIFPFSKEHFIEQYWEKEPLIIKRNDPAYYNSLFGIESVDQVLDTSRPRGGSLRVVKDQVPMLATKFENPDGSLNLNQLYVAYADGYTIVINEMERFWQPLKKFCQNLSSFTSHHAIGNMYLTPKNGKALLPHYDTHDVYVLQIHGKKDWIIYDTPMETPLLNSHQPVFKREQLRNPRKITLEAGDLMYMPRGLPHEASTSDKSSLHITIGTYPAQWADLISQSMMQLANRYPEFRKALPMGYLNPSTWTPEFAKNFTDNFQAMMTKIIAEASPTDCLMMLSEEKRAKQSPKGDGHFAQLDKIDSLNLDSRLVVREGMNCGVQSDGRVSRIFFSGNVIKGPGHIANTLQYIAQKEGAFSLSELPGISDSNKIKLTARLIRGGLLRFA